MYVQSFSKDDVYEKMKEERSLEHKDQYKEKTEWQTYS